MKRFLIFLFLFVFISSSFAGSTLFFRGTSGGSCSAGEKWNAETQTGDSTWSAGSIGWNNYAVWVKSASVGDCTGCTQFRIKVTAGDAQLDIDGSAMCEKAPSGDAWDCATGTLDRITWDTGNNGTSVSASATKYSDWITATNIDLTNPDFVIKHFDNGAFGAGNETQYVDGGGGTTHSWTHWQSNNESQLENASSGYTAYQFLWMVQVIEVQ